MCLFICNTPGKLFIFCRGIIGLKELSDSGIQLVHFKKRDRNSVHVLSRVKITGDQRK